MVTVWLTLDVFPAYKVTEHRSIIYAQLFCTATLHGDNTVKCRQYNFRNVFQCEYLFIYLFINIITMINMKDQIRALEQSFALAELK